MSVMEQYIQLVEFLGKVFGAHCEIALLDLRDDANKIIAIANGEISGRAVGAPVTNLALKIIADGSWKNEDYLCNYKGLTKDNRPLQSSSFFIKENEKLVGMLCINIDTKIFSDVSQLILKLGNVLQMESVDINPASSQEISENFSDSITDILDKIIPDSLAPGYIPPERMTQEEKIAIVKKLNQNGVFLLKGAVSQVADRLNCSEATIYRYLSKIGKNH